MFRIPLFHISNEVKVFALMLFFRSSFVMLVAFAAALAELLFIRYTRDGFTLPPGAKSFLILLRGPGTVFSSQLKQMETAICRKAGGEQAHQAAVTQTEDVAVDTVAERMPAQSGNCNRPIRSVENDSPRDRTDFSVQTNTASETAQPEQYHAEIGSMPASTNKASSLPERSSWHRPQFGNESAVQLTLLDSTVTQKNRSVYTDGNHNMARLDITSFLDAASQSHSSNEDRKTLNAYGRFTEPVSEKSADVNICQKLESYGSNVQVISNDQSRLDNYDYHQVTPYPLPEALSTHSSSNYSLVNAKSGNEQSKPEVIPYLSYSSSLAPSITSESSEAHPWNTKSRSTNSSRNLLTYETEALQDGKLLQHESLHETYNDTSSGTSYSDDQSIENDPTRNIQEEILQTDINRHIYRKYNGSPSCCKSDTEAGVRETDNSNPETSLAERKSPSGSKRRRRRMQNPVQRKAANMRERKRMCHLNVAFDNLKERLPNVRNRKKLSRIQTLRAAIFYISLLTDCLQSA